MGPVVIDASVVVALYVDEPASAASASLLAELERTGAGRHAPDLLLYEVANALRKRVRLGELGPEEALDRLADLAASEIELHPANEVTRPALALAMAHGLSAYDGAYLALAAALGATLITGDQDLAQKAREAGFAVRAIGPE